MSLSRVRAALSAIGLEDRIREFDRSSATVREAAEALGTEEHRIAKTLSFHQDDAVILIVMAGDAKIDNKKYKATFGKKAKMLSAEEVEPLTGHAVGGVCPFALPEGVRVYLDRSLLGMETVYPAAGTPSSAVALTLPELERASHATGFVDVAHTDDTGR